MTNKGKKYRDRQNNEQRIVYWLKRNMHRLSKVIEKASK